jgi:transmembrane sensor
MRKPRVAKAALVVVGLALSLALAGLGTGVLGEPGVLLADVRTGTGESRTVVLEDGSTVQLDTGTAIDVDYTASRRVVRLLAGQIHVTVKPDAGRPFDVDGAGGTTQALGTAFNVRSDPGQVSVTVTEHAVRVRYPAASAGVTVSAGQQVRYGEGIALVPTTANLHALTAWRRGLLTFDDKPLGEVIAELGRYRPGWIVIRDDALRRLPVTGVFSTTDTDEMLDALQATLPVHVRRLPWVTIVESASRD